MESTIWQNEKNSFNEIAKIAKENGTKLRTTAGYMAKSGKLENNNRYSQVAEVYSFTKDGNQILFSENKEIAELSYQYKRSGDSVCITLDKANNQIAYYVHSGPKGHNLLALVTTQGAKIPKYSSERDLSTGLLKFRQEGNLPEMEQGNTVRECIEKTIMEHNSPFGNEVYDVLNGFDHILAIDEERSIMPKTKQEIEIAILKDENNALREKNGVVLAESKASTSQIQELQEQIKTLQEQIEKLKERNNALEGENRDQKKQINKYERMLSVLIKFANKVKESVAGKMFFGKDVKELNLDGKSLPEGEEVSEGDER